MKLAGLGSPQENVVWVVKFIYFAWFPMYPRGAVKMFELFILSGIRSGKWKIGQTESAKTVTRDKHCKII